jgi:hypothetical protein
MSICTWSESFTSKFSPIRESFHRIILSIDVSNKQITDKFIRDCYYLYCDYYRNFLFKISDLSLLPALEDLLAKVLLVFQRKTKQSEFPNDLRFSLQIPLIKDSKKVFSQPFSSIEKLLTPCIQQIHFLIFDAELLLQTIPNSTLITTKAAFIRETLHEYQWLLTMNSTLHYGIQSFDSHDLIDTFLLLERENVPNRFTFVGNHLTMVPNLHSHTIESIHSYGYNSLISISQDYLMENDGELFHEQLQDYYSKIAQKYEISPFTFLGKVYLQLGAILILPYFIEDEVEEDEVEEDEVEEEEDEEIKQSFLQDWKRLVHPFVHRKQHVSTHRLISLWIEQEDMDSIVELSMDQVEMVLDRKRVEEFALAPPTRPIYRFDV